MAATVGDFIAFVRQIAHQRQLPIPLEGFVWPGSWNPDDGTVHVVVGHTYALPLPGENQDPNDDATVIIPNPVPLLTNHVGDQGGPIGGERCILFPYEDGHSYVAMLMAGQDDSPHVPAGEKHIYLRSEDVALALTCFLKVQEDAIRIGHLRKVVVRSPVINLGAEFLPETNGIPRLIDFQKALDDMALNVQQAFDTFSKTVQPGSGAPPPVVRFVTATASKTSFTL